MQFGHGDPWKDSVIRPYAPSAGSSGKAIVTLALIAICYVSFLSLVLAICRHAYKDEPACTPKST
jgi:hypothetical protein